MIDFWIAINIDFKRYQGYVGAALVLGGVDKFGPRLYSVAPHGSTDKLPYATMGSGSLAAMAVFETRWKPDLSVSFFFNRQWMIFIFIFQFDFATTKKYQVGRW